MNITPRGEYPRPDFKRDSFISLNGNWQFSYDDENIGIADEWYDVNHEALNREIVVPFTYLCELSGINEQDFHDIVWYRKEIDFTKKNKEDRVILHFGAIDYVADVWVNGKHVVNHEGGNTPVDIDVTEAIADLTHHVIVVRAYDDSTDFELPRGKQYWKKTSESIFYTRTVGIWQSVWMEEVPKVYLKHTKVTSYLDEREIEVEFELSDPGNATVEVVVTRKGVELLRDSVYIKNTKAKRRFWFDSKITIDWNHQESWAWSPENPVLFDISYEIKDQETGEVNDHVDSYFAFRKIDIVNGEIILNDRPYYMKMLLDQGYWRKSLLTAPTDQAFIDDIENAKKMGFNGVRKHQKVEDPRYLYWADKLGFLVWGESASSYEYSDTAVDRHVREWYEIVRRDYNHPCIVAWVPLNESWGVQEIYSDKKEQSHALTLYHLVKSLDQTRLVISNDGWIHTKSDIITIHDYCADRETLLERYSNEENILEFFPGGRPLFAKGYERSSEPFMVTEFGGISFCVDNTEGWGYSNATNKEEFLKCYENVVAPLLASKHVKGFVYTQLTDVEQEINGLMTYDREFKVDPEKIKCINEGKKYN